MLSYRSWIVTAALVLPLAQAKAALQFVDWTVVNLGTNVASGNVGSIGVTMSGGDIDFGVTNGSSMAFSSSLFNPQLPTSDLVGFRGQNPAYTYLVTFTQAVTNPVMHLASLASTLAFSGINPIKVSGEATFTVAGNTVSGVAVGSSDSNGTIMLPGVFTSLSFTALYTTADGVATQIGFDPVAVPEPPAGIILGAGLALVAAILRRKNQRIGQ